MTDTTEAEAESADEKITMALGFPNSSGGRTDGALFTRSAMLLCGSWIQQRKVASSPISMNVLIGGEVVYLTVA